jgi:glutathione S-transferase
MKLYANAAATTSRAVMAFIEHVGLDVQLVPVDLMTGEHHQAPFSELNPNRLVPVLDDDGFVLTESSAILRYLAAKTESELYPTDIRERARVDELIAWFEANFYKDFGYQFVYPQLFPHHSRGSDEANQATIAFGKQQSCERLAVLDRHYLGDERRFLVGGRLTIADLHGASILSLGELIGCSLDAYPNVRRWYEATCALDAWSQVNHSFLGYAASLKDQTFVGLG